jgi:diaminohydroxyphosphoribosylaminopyrimidine deaminase/5-amino-6-(5-phosphoribosylamino)uracil reductase
LAAQQPLRVIVDGRLRLPLTHDLVARAGGQATLLITRPDAPAERRAAYESAGVQVEAVELGAENTLSATAIVRCLGARGLTRVLVEGGSKLAAGLLRADLVDEVVWFRAPSVIGSDGVPAVAGFGLETLGEMPRFRRVAGRALGADVMETFRRNSED